MNKSLKNPNFEKVLALIDLLQPVINNVNKVSGILNDVIGDLKSYMKIIDASVKNDIKIPDFTIQNYERIFEEHKNLMQNFINEWAEIKPF